MPDTILMVEEGDTLERLRAMPDGFVDAVVTDPPYGLSEHTPEEVNACLAAWTRGEPYDPSRGKGKKNCATHVMRSLLRRDAKSADTKAGDEFVTLPITLDSGFASVLFPVKLDHQPVRREEEVDHNNGTGELEQNLSTELDGVLAQPFCDQILDLRVTEGASCDGPCTCYTKISQTEFRVRVRLSHDTFRQTEPSADVVAGARAEDVAVLAFDLSRRSVTLLSTDGTGEVDTCFLLCSAHGVGTSAGTGGLPPVAKAGSVSGVAPAALRARSFNLRTHLGLLDFFGSPRVAKSGMMGKTWDAWVPGPECWREVYRVLKPGGHALVFAGSRTSDLMGIALRLAGFEIRDEIDWRYCSGFPKSLNVSKAIDKAQGHERKSDYVPNLANKVYGTGMGGGRTTKTEPPATPEGLAWDGWGTALKPAREPIWVVRKPLVGTVAENVLAHGTGALHIDACRIAYASEADKASATPQGECTSKSSGAIAASPDAGRDLDRIGFERPEQKGRFPANVVLSHAEDCVCVGTWRFRGSGSGAVKQATSAGHTGNALGAESRPAGTPMLSHVDADGLETMERWACVPGCPVRVLDDQSGERKGSPKAWKRGEADQFSGRVYTSARGEETMQGYGDTGGASRFFYTAKASRRDRNTCVDGVHRAGVSNAHPTVKPIELMRWLVRLVTPPSGLVLDPFNGSGTTGVSAALEGFHYIGIEGEAENCQITRRRFLQAPLVEAPQGQQEQTDGQPSNEAVDPSGVPDGDTGGGDGPA